MPMKTIRSPLVIEPPPQVKSNCKVYRDQVFVSGMTGRGADGTTPAGMYAQAHAAFAKIRALMESAGGCMDDVISITVYVTEMNVPEFWRARREFFTGDYPTSTFVQVAALAQPEFVIEISAIGFVGASR